MANGTGAVITGLIIGIIIATQAGDFESVDIDLPETNSDWDADADSDADSDLDADQDIDQDPSAYPTQIDGGITDVAMAGAITTVGAGDPVVTLTFSSGPDPAYTPQILDILDRHDAPAIFCVDIEQAREHPELIRRIANDGHTLCSHEMSEDLDLAIHAAAPGVEVPYFRAPGGSFSTDVTDLAVASGYIPLGWSLDPYRWEQPGVTAISDTVVDEVVPGDIVLLYDGGGDRSDTVTALAALITGLRNEGYEIVVP